MEPTGVGPAVQGQQSGSLVVQREISGQFVPGRQHTAQAGTAIDLQVVDRRSVRVAMHQQRQPMPAQDVRDGVGVGIHDLAGLHLPRITTARAQTFRRDDALGQRARQEGLLPGRCPNHLPELLVVDIRSAQAVAMHQQRGSASDFDPQQLRAQCHFGTPGILGSKQKIPVAVLEGDGHRKPGQRGGQGLGRGEARIVANPVLEKIAEDV